MNQITATIFTISILIIGIACSTTREWRKELKQEWIGKSKKELLMKLGQPNKLNTVDVPDTEILIYIHQDFTPDIPPNTYSKDFFINKDSIIYKIETYSW
jgi:hypothetical protein